MTKRPCKDCKERKINCSKDCKKLEFIVWQTEQEIIKKNRQRSNEYFSYIFDVHNRIAKRKET